jgi:hypothetical protein
MLYEKGNAKLKNKKTVRSCKKASRSNPEDPFGRAQMIWTVMVALTVSFFIFQKNTRSPAQESWKLEPIPKEKSRTREVASPDSFLPIK